MFEDIGSLMPSPKEFVVGVIIAVFVHILLGFLNLMFGKSKNAIFTFTKERSEKQRAVREKRVEMMKRDERSFHFHLALMNNEFLKGIVFLGLSIISLVGVFTTLNVVPTYATLLVLVNAG